MAKRGENIYKRKDGRYEGRYIKGRRADGKPFFGYIYAYTYAQVKTKLTAAKAAAGGIMVNSCDFGTVSEFSSFWLENIISKQVKPSTYSRYYERINKYVLPALGNIRISRFTHVQAQSFADDLLNSGLAASTVAGIIGTLRSMMRKAKEIGAAEINPCDNITLPETNAKKARALDRAEQIKLETMAIAEGKGVELAVFLSLYTGLRIGELCALRWGDVDLSARTITVKGTVQRIRNFAGGNNKTSIIEGTPKSKTSLRTIPLSSGITELLSKRTMPKNCYLLSGNAKKLEPRTVRKWFDKLTKKAELDITFHTLRHTFATRCLEHNFDVQTLSELLGHSNATITMQVYAHSILSHKRLLVDRIQILS